MPRVRSPRLTKKPRGRYHHGDLRPALLQAAIRTIEKHGVEALTLRAVGEELGVSRSALYRHFTDKAALLAAVANEGFRMLRLGLTSAWQDDGKGRSGFSSMGEAYIRFALEHPWHYRVMFASGFDASAPVEPRANGPGAFQVLVDALAELQEQGLVRRDDPVVLARFVWALVHGIAMLAIDGPLQRQAADVNALTRLALERLYTGIAMPP